MISLYSKLGIRQLLALLRLRSVWSLAAFALALLSTAQSFAAEVESTYRRSGRSGTGDDARTSVQCASTEILVGCECYSPWGSCDGAFATASTRTCTAQNREGGSGVYAEAVCLEVPSGVAKAVVTGGWSGTGDDQESVASCNSSAPVLTGCTCFSNWGGCDGAYFLPDTNTCVAKNGNSSGGSGVRAFALCAELRPNPEDIETREGARSAKNDDAQSTVSCPAGYTMTGCSCYSPWQSCDGARPKQAGPNSCTAYNRNGGSGVYAQVECVDFSASGCASSCGGVAPAGCFCDADCQAFGDCCTDYAQQCL